ncbi:MAG: hypothetical protein ACI9S8_002991 [Chlamydiales bacterium]|jgi:hypothetical protein
MLESSTKDIQRSLSEEPPIIFNAFTQIGVEKRIQSIEIHLSTDQAIIKLVKADGTKISPFEVVGFPKITQKQHIDALLKMFYIKVTELRGNNTTEYKVDCQGRLIGGGIGCSCMAKKDTFEERNEVNNSFVQQGCRTDFSNTTAEDIEQALTFFDRALSSREADSEDQIRNFLLPYFETQYNSNMIPKIYKGATLLHLSSANAIKILLKNPFMNPDLLDGYGNTALVHVALLYANIPNFTAFYTLEISQALLACGADINASVNDWWGETNLKGKTAFDLFKDCTTQHPLDTGLLNIIELFSRHSSEI